MLEAWAVRRPGLSGGMDSRAQGIPVSTECYSCGVRDAEFWQYIYDGQSLRVDSKCVRCEARDRVVYG